MKRIINAETGEIIERELNAEEIAQQGIDESELAEIKKLQDAQNELKQKAKAAAEAKLVALGLDLDDLRALGL
jgi:hypothetical protein